MSLFITILSFRGIKKITILFFFLRIPLYLKVTFSLHFRNGLFLLFFFLIPNVFLFPLLANVLLLKATEQVHMT